MDKLFLVALGAFLVLLCWLLVLVVKHGWGWVLNWLETRKVAAETKLKAQAQALVGTFEARLQTIESDLATVKAKVMPAPVQQSPNSNG